MSATALLCPPEDGACPCGQRYPWHSVAHMMRGTRRYRCDCGRRFVIDYHAGYGVRLEVSPAQWQAVKQLPEGVPMADVLAVLRTMEAV